jgi:hypothetical protein
MVNEDQTERRVARGEAMAPEAEPKNARPARMGSHSRRQPNGSPRSESRSAVSERKRVKPVPFPAAAPVFVRMSSADSPIRRFPDCAARVLLSTLPGVYQSDALGKVMRWGERGAVPSLNNR